VTTTTSAGAGPDVRPIPPPSPNPLRVLVSPISWGAVLYCFTSIVGGGLALLAGVVGIFMLPLVVWVTANLERTRIVLIGLPRLTPLPRSGVRHPWDPKGLGDGNLAVWGLTVLFAIVDAVPGGVLAVLTLGLGQALWNQVSRSLWSMTTAIFALGLVVILVVGLYVAWALAAAQASVVGALLRPHSDLKQQVDELQTSRRELVDVFAAERRRIEHDLHDGAQQHLVLLTMQLGEADYALDEGRIEDARRALDAARDSVEAAMTSLRETVRGIHPQILTDRGLVPAVRELAGRQPLPVQVEVSGEWAPAEQLSLAAYYVVSEAFTNIVKHAGATRATVRLVLADPLQVEVYDDGRGGAVVRPGHGLSGLVERTRALGGGCWLSSPPGGPTLLRASFPNPR
jgi:signal transduction histidine kinase